MKTTIFQILGICILLAGCTKAEPTRTSGIDTIDNITYQVTTYYVYGFLFSQAKLVPTYPKPGPDITVDVNKDNQPYRLTLQANNLVPSFYKVGDFDNESDAKATFDNLKNVSVTQWSEMADTLSANQVWIYKSGTENYAKIRIVSTINEIRDGMPYGECTFQWVYQPDGTSTFPGK